jgi:hypothetical protein
MRVFISVSGLSTTLPVLKKQWATRARGEQNKRGGVYLRTQTPMTKFCKCVGATG